MAGKKKAQRKKTAAKSVNPKTRIVVAYSLSPEIVAEINRRSRGETRSRTVESLLRRAIGTLLPTP